MLYKGVECPQIFISTSGGLEPIPCGCQEAAAPASFLSPLYDHKPVGMTGNLLAAARPGPGTQEELNKLFVE